MIFGRKDLTKDIKLWHILILGFVVGAALMWIPPIYKEHHPEFSAGLKALLDLLERLGDAIVIAVLIGGGIERIIRQTEFRESALTSFVAIFGRMLPPQLQVAIRSYLEISIIRSWWGIVYKIEECSGRPGCIQLDTEIEYSMQNRSEQPKVYEFVYEVEDSLCPGMQTDIRSWKKARTDSKSKKTEWVEEPNVANKVKQEEGSKVLHVPIGNLEPYNDDTKTTYHFHVESTEYFEQHIVSPFSSFYPTVETKFTIFYDPAKFEVSFEMTHGEPPDPHPVSDNSKPGEYWEITEPILPGQGFVVRCRLK